MQTLAEAPGVISAPARLYVNTKDIMIILGCEKSKASNYIKEINNKVKNEGGIAFPAGKVNKYLFSEMARLPIEDINNVLAANDRKE